MPQSTQIIPNYMHPHLHEVLNDNTGFQDGVASTPSGTRSIFVVNTPKGRDGEFYTVGGQTEFLEEYGVPVFNTHGQPAFNAYAFLGNSQVRAEILRVTAEDATYANSVIVAKAKDNGDGTMTVIITAVSLEDLQNKEEFESRVQLLRTTTPDADGWISFPIFGAMLNGKGVYGNAFRTRIVKDFSADNDNPFVNYRLEFNEFTDALRTRNAWSGTLYEDAVHLRKTLYLFDTVDVDDKAQANIVIPQDSLEAFHDFYISVVNPATPVPFEQFDFLYGLEKGEDALAAINPIEGIVFDTEHLDYVSLDSVEGLVFASGTDGAFASSDLAVRQEALNTAYAKAFRGEIDRSILSKRRLPQDVFFDANYADDVKLVIRAWLVGRNEAIGYLDAGKREDWDEIRFWAEDEYQLGSMVVCRELHHYKAICPFTNKKIEVTYPHFLATELVNHWNSVGNQSAFVGDASQLYGHYRRSLKPIIDFDDKDIKEFLYLNRVNYVHAIKEEVFQRGTASTSLPGKVSGSGRSNKSWWSDLNEECYVHVLLQMKRELEEYLATQNYVFAEQRDRDQFTLVADDMMEKYRGSKVQSVEVYFAMSDYEKQRSILHCYLAVRFKTMAKRHILEIDIESRV